MIDNRHGDDLPLNNADDLQAVLGAWHTATLRLEKTHEALRSEVQRLSNELEVKNRELARKNRLADLGQIAAHVAHEVRNNLVPVTLYLSLLRRQFGDNPKALDTLTKMETGCSALEACVNDLLNFASDREPNCRQVDLAALIEETVTALAPQLAAQGIGVCCENVEPMELHVDGDMLRSAVLNLMLNAVDAMPQGGELVITTVCHSGQVELEIADSGAGLPTDAVLRVFEPFFTTKGSGTGLGLAVVERVAEAHGGQISCRNCPEGGAAFTLHLPIKQLAKVAA